MPIVNASTEVNEQRYAQQIREYQQAEREISRLLQQKIRQQQQARAKKVLQDILDNDSLAKNITTFTHLTEDNQDYALHACDFSNYSPNHIDSLETGQRHQAIHQRIHTQYLIKNFDTSPPLQASRLKNLWALGMSNKEITKHYSGTRFIITLEAFLEKLDNTAMDLTNSEIACLHAILAYFYYGNHDYPANKNISPLHYHFMLQLLIYAGAKPNEIYNVSRSFEERMKNIIEHGFLPYARIMNPEILLDIQTTGNTTPIVEFIMAYTNLIPPKTATVQHDSLYAPKATITAEGIQLYLSHIFNWPLVFDASMPDLKLNVTAGNVPAHRSIEEDKKYWPEIIEDMFKQFLHNRTLILDAICQRQPLLPLERIPQDLETLRQTLISIETNMDSEVSVDTRVIRGYEQYLFSWKISLGCHLILDAIASAITKELLARTEKKREEELSHYPPDDDQIGKEIDLFHRMVFKTVYGHIKDLVNRHGTQQKIPVSISAADFLLFIEITYENRLNLSLEDAMEAPGRAQLPDSEAYSPYQQTLHYNKVATYIHPKNRETATDLETAQQLVLNIAHKEIATIKEILLFVLYFHHLPESDPNRTTLISAFPRLMHAFFFIKRLQIETGYYHSSDKNKEDLNFYIQQVFASVSKIEVLLNAYIHYFLEQKNILIEPEECIFLQGHLEKIQRILQSSINPIRPESFLLRMIPLSKPRFRYSNNTFLSPLNAHQTITEPPGILDYEQVKKYCIDQLVALSPELSGRKQSKWQRLSIFSESKKTLNAIRSVIFLVELADNILELYQKIDEAYHTIETRDERVSQILLNCLDKIQVSIHGYRGGIDV